MSETMRCPSPYCSYGVDLGGGEPDEKCNVCAGKGWVKRPAPAGTGEGNRG